MNISKLRVLILGSEGFIGSNAVSYFTQKGYFVYKADIVIKEEKNYTIINPEHTDFSSLFNEANYDACINATGSANVQFSFNNPALDYSLNVSNVFHILNAIRRCNPGCKFINLSSAAVYGNPKSLPIIENSVLTPLSPYGWHKLYSEQICKEFAVFFGLKTLSVRIFSAYGDGLKKQLFWDLNQKLLNTTKDKTITLFGTGDETRDFIYISDVLMAIECILVKSDFDGSAINIASGIETKIRDVVELFITLQEIPCKVEFSNQVKIGDPSNWRADITKLKELGFSQQTSIEGGLKNYIQWLREKR